MSVDKNKVLQRLSETGGRESMNALYPNEFEYYLCAFELFDSANQLLSTFVFPVMPNMISHKDSKLVSIRKTSSAVTISTNVTFIPVDISIQGTFGRKLRLLVGNTQSEGSAFGFGLSNLIPGAEFSSEVKTGYGAFRLLDALISKSQTIDDKGGPHYLYFYNLALGKNYLAEVLDFTSSQSLENNMIWNYSIQMKGVADADSIDVRTESEKKQNISLMLSKKITSGGRQISQSLDRLDKEIVKSSKETTFQSNYDPKK